MSEPEAKPASPRPRRRKWLRRIGLGLLVIVVAGILFHRPLLRRAIHHAVVEFARFQNVELSLEVEGDFLTSIRLRNIRGRPIGASPVEAVSVGMAGAHYSFWRLLRQGPSHFLTSYHLHDATLVISPVKATQEQKTKLTNLLRDILEQPALFSDQIDIRNLNLTVHGPEGDIVVRKLDFTLDPVAEGRIRAEEIVVPPFIAWRDIDAPTSYVQRHLAVANLRLDPRINVSKVVLDSSRRDEGVNYLSFRGQLMGGEVGLFLWRRKTEQEDYVQFTAAVSGLSLRELSDFLRLESPLEGTLTHFWAQLGGSPDEPATWQADAAAEIDGFHAGGVEVGDIRANLAIHNGMARLYDTEVRTGENRLALKGEHPLPETPEAVFSDHVDLELEINAPDLARFRPAVITGGQAAGKGTLRLRDRRIHARMETTLQNLGIATGKAPLSVGRGHSVMDGTYSLADRKADAPWHAGLALETTTTLETVRSEPWGLDRASLNLALKEGAVVVDAVEIRSGESVATASGRMTLPAGALTWPEAAFDARFALNVPSLAAFRTVAEGGFDGVVNASGEISKASGAAAKGDLSVEATRLVYQEFQAERLSVRIPVEDNLARITTFELDINGTDKLSGTGTLRLEAPYPYEGAISGAISDLSIFTPLLKRPLAGALQIDWRGTGELGSLLRHSGEANLEIHEGLFDGITGIDAAVAGTYSPEAVSLPTFRFRSDQGGVQTVVRFEKQRLHLDPIRIDLGSGEGGVVKGRLSAQLDLDKLEERTAFLPPDGAIEGQLALERIAIPRLLAALPKPPAPAPGEAPDEKAVHAPPRRVSAREMHEPPKPEGPAIAGEIQAAVTFGGTFGAPEVVFRAEGHDITSSAAPQMDPAQFATTLTFRDDRLDLSGNIRLTNVSPLTFAGNIPLPLSSVAETGKLDPATPVRFNIRLPSSPASVVTRFVPAIRYAEGTVRVDASVEGTIGQPVFAGGILLNIPALRFANSNLPGVSDFQADLQFSEHRLTFRRFNGNLAGGTFGLTGSLLLRDLQNPMIDLRLGSKGVLLVRNQSVTVRADTDIAVTGPLKTAAVKGSVGINQSRFFREIEILPLGLPGDPAPKPVEAAPSAPSIDIPPFRDWTFDVEIKTTEPFIIRSNLAQGRVRLDLRLGGTGLAPSLEGMARIHNLVASLPFSRLEVERGYVYFVPGDPFNPILDIRGTSRIRNYNITAYIYGTANKPETVFTSEPPLAQEEIIALLATGATTEEITEDSSLLAGRAAVLLLQDLYRKVFKRNAPPPSLTDKDDFRDRFRFDVGSVDPRTGRQQLGGTFRVTRDIEIGAGLDIEGDVRAEVRYLIRFR